jgi:hypothetical protein
MPLEYAFTTILLLVVFSYLVSIELRTNRAISDLALSRRSSDAEVSSTVAKLLLVGLESTPSTQSNDDVWVSPADWRVYELKKKLRLLGYGRRLLFVIWVHYTVAVGSVVLFRGLSFSEEFVFAFLATNVLFGAVYCWVVMMQALNPLQVWV